MKRCVLVFVLSFASLASMHAFAQQPAAAPQTPRGGTPAQAPRGATPTPVSPAPTPPVPTTRRQGQPVNVKIEFTLTDQQSGGAAVKRTLSLIVADAMGGSIRSQSDVAGVTGGVPLNIDANPELLADGKIRLGFTVQYDWPAPIEEGRDLNSARRGTVLKTAMRESVSLILESGKPMVAAQSADPIGDRQVTVEVKATVLK
jgi:hypothetical protein